MNIKSGDKYLHFTAYFGLTLLWYFALKDRINKKVFKFFVPLAIIIYGIILEVLQGGITNYRTGDFYDVVANTIGVLIAVLLINKFISWFKAI